MASYHIKNNRLSRKATEEQNLQIMQLNCNGIIGRLAELKLLIYTKKPDIVCLCETWIEEQHGKPKFIGYTDIWKCRGRGERGGLGILIREDVTFQKKDHILYDNGYMELLSIVVKHNMGVLDVVNIYNPSKNITTDEFLHYFSQLGCKYIMTGDYNAHSPQWDARGRYNETGHAIEESMELLGVGLLNDRTPTYIDRRTGTTSCLDLCLTSQNLLRVGEFCRGPDIGSDHFPMIWTFGIAIEKTELNTVKRWQVRKANWPQWQQLMEEDAQSEIGPVDAETANIRLTAQINRAAQKAIPMSSGKIGCHRSTPWWDAECSKAVALRRKAKGKLFRAPTVENLIEYKRREAIVKRTTLKKKRESWAEFVGSLSSETTNKIVWRKIRSINGKNNKTNYAVGNLVDSEEDKANLFADWYSRYNREGVIRDMEIMESNKTYLSTRESESEVQPINLYEVQSSIKTLKNTSPGDDCINNIFIKKMGKKRIIDITGLFNISLTSSMVPSEWKLCVWIPILKPGKDPTQVGSYRPIAMLSCIGKLMERVIQRRLEFKLEREHLLKGEQDGFRRGKSTMDSLLIIKNFITTTYEQQEYCITVYLDLEGAYDGVWHQGLIHKLINLGIEKTYIRWIGDYLKDRKGKVRIGASESRVVNNISGLPQGAVLSPLLFNVMLYDMPVDEDIQLVIYADDITILARGKVLDEVRNKVQNYLDRLMEWVGQWKLQVNPGKCYQQIFTKKRAIQEIIIRVNNVVLHNVPCKRVLGVVLDAPKLTFNNHMTGLRTVINKRLNVIRAISSTRWGASRKLIRTVYISFIRSRMEYGSIIFGELSNKNIRLLEVLQNQALRSILGARKTTPIMSLEIESFVAPISLRFRFLEIRWYIRLMHRGRMDNTVGQLKLGSRERMAFKENCQANLTLMQLPPIQRIHTEALSAIPPWVDFNIDINWEMAEREPGMEMGMQGMVRDLVQQMYQGAIEIYTDGSKLENGSTTAAVYVPHTSFAMGWLLNRDHTILGAELYGIYKAIELSNSDSRMTNKDIVILTDSKSSLQLIANTRDPTYRQIVFTIQEMIQQKRRANKVYLQWVKGHAGIKGNEIADRVAVMSHNNNRTALTKLNYDEAVGSLHATFLEYWTKVWKTSVIMTGKGQFLSNLVDKPQLQLWKSMDSRRMESVAARLRMGHVGVGSHMHRFGMRDNNQCQECSVPDTVDHFIMNCTKYDQLRCAVRLKLQRISVDFNLRNILGCGDHSARVQKKIQNALENYVRGTGKLREL